MWRKDLLRAQIDDLYNDARSRLQNQTPSVPLIAATPVPNISKPKLSLEQLQSTKMVFELAKEKEALLIIDDDEDVQHDNGDDGNNNNVQGGYDSDDHVAYNNIKQEEEETEQHVQQQEQSSKKRSPIQVPDNDDDDDDGDTNHRYNDDDISTTIVETSNAIDDDPMDNATVIETKIPTNRNKRKATTRSKLEPAAKKPRIANSRRRDVIEKIATDTTSTTAAMFATPTKPIKRENSNHRHSHVHNVIIPIVPSTSPTTTPTKTKSQPKYVRGFFTEQERELFKQGVAKYEQDFALIQHEFLPHRSKDQIKDHYKYTVLHEYKRKQYKKTYATNEHEYKKRLRRERKLVNGDRFNGGPWTREEHARFLAGVTKYGRGKWKLISNMVVTRSMDQVSSHGAKYFRKMRLHGYPVPRSHRGWEDKPDNPWEPDSEFEKSLNMLIEPRVKGKNQLKLDNGEPITEADLEVYLELGSVPKLMRMENVLHETSRTTLASEERVIRQQAKEKKQQRVQHVVQDDDDDDVADDEMPMPKPPKPASSTITPLPAEKDVVVDDGAVGEESQEPIEEFVIEDDEDSHDFELEPDDSENDDIDDSSDDDDDLEKKQEKILLLQLFHYPKRLHHAYAPQQISEDQIKRIAQNGTRAKYKHNKGTSPLYLKRNMQLHRQPKRTRIKPKR